MWDGLLYIKSVSDRIYSPKRTILPQRVAQKLRRNRQRIRKIPLKSMISEGFWSEWRGSNSRPDGPKLMSELSARGLAPSLALSGTPAVPLWNSIGLFISGTAFGFWDLCGMEFCILKVLPTGFTSNSGCFCRREQLRNCAA